MQQKSHKITFVCHGNICRSPMAEFILKELAHRRGIECLTVLSRALHSDALGCDMYGKSRAVLLLHGIPFSPRSARLITQADYDWSDLVLVMDSYNLSDITRRFGSDRVKKLKDYIGGGDIADPWYTGDFELTYSEIYAACESLLNTLAF